jgi:hypothetical protein
MSVIYSAMREQGAIGSHRVVGTDDAGWLQCAVTIIVDGTRYRVEFDAAADYSDWTIVTVAPVPARS